MMSVPEDWAWLEEMPEGWPTPAEITGPTAVPVTNLVLLMLSSEMLGNDLVELIGEFIAEDARFNSWIGAEGKHELSMRQVAECSALLRECTKIDLRGVARLLSGVREGAAGSRFGFA
ncbi:hypothetical protein [Streptomyces ambofaciens]